DSVNGFSQGGARLHLDNGDETATPGDEVDLAQRGADAPSDDAITLEHKSERCEPLAAVALAIGALARKAGISSHCLSPSSAQGASDRVPISSRRSSAPPRQQP